MSLLPILVVIKTVNLTLKLPLAQKSLHHKNELCIGQAGIARLSSPLLISVLRERGTVMVCRPSCIKPSTFAVPSPKCPYRGLEVEMANEADHAFLYASVYIFSHKVWVLYLPDVRLIQLCKSAVMLQRHLKKNLRVMTFPELILLINKGNHNVFGEVFR